MGILGNIISVMGQLVSAVTVHKLSYGMPQDHRNSLMRVQVRKPHLTGKGQRINVRQHVSCWQTIQIIGERVHISVL